VWLTLARLIAGNRNATGAEGSESRTGLGRSNEIPLQEKENTRLLDIGYPRDDCWKNGTPRMQGKDQMDCVQSIVIGGKPPHDKARMENPDGFR